MESTRLHTLETDAPRADTSSMSTRTFPVDRSAPRAAAAWFRGLPTGLSASRLADAELCVDELVTNVVRYAFTDGGPHTITVHVERSSSEVEIVIQDDGRPFDPTAAPLPAMPRTLDEAVPGGRGLLLVRSIAPRLGYERRDGVNRVILGFPLDPHR